MKKLLLILLLGNAAAACQKSNNNNSGLSSSHIPGGVTGSFSSRYPSASGQIEWEKEWQCL